jgi:hypothetical protein
VSKYGNIKTTVDGYTFDSKKEAARYSELRLLERAGRIKGLMLQQPFRVELNRVHVFTYRADFVYFENGARVVEDVKGYATPLYRLKKRILKALYNVDIRET